MLINKVTSDKLVNKNINFGKIRWMDKEKTMQDLANFALVGRHPVTNDKATVKLEEIFDTFQNFEDRYEVFNIGTDFDGDIFTLNVTSESDPMPQPFVYKHNIWNSKTFKLTLEKLFNETFKPQGSRRETVLRYIENEMNKISTRDTEENQ